jgi:hypothetical protein
MSKHKNKKNKPGKQLNPVTRKDLCVRIYELEKENMGLRSANEMLSMTGDVQNSLTKKSIKLAEEAEEKLAASVRIANEYRKLNRFLIAALIISSILHLVSIFM